MRKKLTRKEVIEMKFERIDKEITDILEKKSLIQHNVRQNPKENLKYLIPLVSGQGGFQ